MSNMSYCRFENTLNDLKDCVWAMEEAETLDEMDLSSYEKTALFNMAELCEEFLRHVAKFEETTTE